MHCSPPLANFQFLPRLTCARMKWFNHEALTDFPNGSESDTHFVGGCETHTHTHTHKNCIHCFTARSSTMWTSGKNNFCNGLASLWNWLQSLALVLGAQCWSVSAAVGRILWVWLDWKPGPKKVWYGTLGLCLFLHTEQTWTAETGSSPVLRVLSLHFRLCRTVQLCRPWSFPRGGRNRSCTLFFPGARSSWFTTCTQYLTVSLLQLDTHNKPCNVLENALMYYWVQTIAITVRRYE